MGLLRSPRDICYFALVIPRVWTLFFLRNLSSLGPTSYEFFWLGEVLAAIALGVYFLMPGNASRRLNGKGVFAIGVVSCLPCFLLLVATQDQRWIILTAAVLGGAAMVWFYAACADVYARLDYRKAVGYVLGSFVLGALLRFPLELVPLEAATVLCIFLPIAFAFALWETGRIPASTPTDIEEEPRGAAGNIAVNQLAIYLLALFLFSFTLGCFFSNYDGADANGLVTLLVLVYKTALPLVFLWAFTRWRDVLRLSFVCVVAFMIVLTFVTSYFAAAGNGRLLVASVASDLARYSISLLFVVTLVALARRQSIHPASFFCFGWVVFPFANLLGMLVSGQMGVALSGTTTIFLLYAFTFATVVLLLAGMRTRSDFALFPSEQISTAPLETEGRTIDAQCQLLSKTHGLTEREGEVLRYIARGNTRKSIAEKMTISENTVKSYAKNAYRKLSIHSRQELLDLIDNYQ